MMTEDQKENLKEFMLKQLNGVLSSPGFYLPRFLENINFIKIDKLFVDKIEHEVIVGKSIEISSYTIVEHYEKGIAPKLLRGKLLEKLTLKLMHIAELDIEDLYKILDIFRDATKDKEQSDRLENLSKSIAAMLNLPPDEEPDHLKNNDYLDKYFPLPYSAWIVVKDEKVEAVNKSFKQVITRDMLPYDIIDEIFSFEFDTKGSNYTEHQVPPTGEIAEQA